MREYQFRMILKAIFHAAWLYSDRCPTIKEDPDKAFETFRQNELQRREQNLNK